MSELKIFVGHNNPDGDNWDLETSDWCAVIAPSVEVAMAMIAAKVEIDCREGDDWKEFVEITRQVEIPDSKYFGAETYPRYITRGKELRLLGFRYEDEEACESCGLFANGVSYFQVCDDCLTCVDCGGCQCEGEAND